MVRADGAFGAGPSELIAANRTGTVTVGFEDLSAGDNTGTVTFALYSDGAGTSGLDSTPLGEWTVSLSATGWRLAELDVGPSPIDLGEHHVGDAIDVSQYLSVNNTATADGYSEALTAWIGGSSGAVTHR